MARLKSYVSLWTSQLGQIQWHLFACHLCLLVHCVMWDLFPLQPNGEETDGEVSNADSGKPGAG